MSFVRFILVCTDVVNDFLGKNGPYLAGAIAFYTLFSMFPLVLAVISVAGFFVGPEVEESELAERIVEVIPVSTEFIGETMRGVASARAITGAASLIGLIWASSAAFGVIRKGINSTWGITRARPFLRERLIDFGLVAGAGLLLVMFLVVTPLVGTIEQTLRFLFPEFDVSLALKLVSQIGPPVVGFGTFLVLYRFLPNATVRLVDVWPGALGAALAFEGAKRGFLWYVETFPVYNVVYGPLGAIMALLTWVYVSAIILLFGALATSRFAKYADNLNGDVQGFRLLWTGLSRVRLRVVAAGDVGT